MHKDNTPNFQTKLSKLTHFKDFLNKAEEEKDELQKNNHTKSRDTVLNWWKDVGRFLDFPFIPYNVNSTTLNYKPIPQKLMDYGGGDFNFINQPGSNFFPTGYNYDGVRYKYKNKIDYYTNNIIVSGLTEDRLENFTSYGYTGTSKYIPDFDVDKGFYVNYLNGPVDGITRIISLNDFNPIIYTEDADLNDPNLGTKLQGDGILFKTYSGVARTVSNLANPNQIFWMQKV
jgi:hypothetical protein